jgi:predicted secreted protein
MATLKGQNFRLLTYDAQADTYKVIAQSTNCTITLTNNTDDASHKDVVGMAAMPTVTSKAWQVQCESLNVTDAATVLAAIKSLTPFTLVWDETATADNQTGQHAAVARTGQAYLSDVTFQWNDRENSTKQIQFTGTGAITEASSSYTTDVIAVSNTFTKGQFVRLFLGSDNTAIPATVVAYAKTLSLHVSMTMENATTKDTEGDWDVQDPTELNYDISTSALVRSGDTITSEVEGKALSDIEDIYESSSPVKWLIANVSGDNQRTMGTVIASGSCIISQLSIQAVKTAATYQATLTGYGAYTVGS